MSKQPEIDCLAIMLEASADEWSEDRPDLELIGEALSEAERLVAAGKFTQAEFERIAERVQEIAANDAIMTEEITAELRAMLRGNG